MKGSNIRDILAKFFCYIIVAIMGLFFLHHLFFFLQHYHPPRKSGSTANCLKQMGLVFKMYAKDDPNNLFPPVSRYKNMWVPDIESIYPEYLSDLNVLVNDRSPDCKKHRVEIKRILEQEPIDWEAITRIAAENFVYTGWIVMNDDEAIRLTKRRKNISKSDIDSDIKDSVGTLYRMGEGKEAFLIADINNPAAQNMAQSTAPIMFENMNLKHFDKRHKSESTYSKCNVLYMDGHVESLKYGQEFPFTDTVSELFRPPEE